MALIENLRKQWKEDRQKEIDELRGKYSSSISWMIFCFILAGLNVWWICTTESHTTVEPVEAFGITWGAPYERVSYLYIFEWFVMIITGLMALGSIGSLSKKKESLKKAEAVSVEQYIYKQEKIFKSLNIQCPKCQHWFEKELDNLKRYTLGTAKNVGKFVGKIALEEGGSMLGDVVSGGNEYVSEVGSRAGGKLAESLGLTTYDGWKHQCPYCKNKWK